MKTIVHKNLVIVAGENTEQRGDLVQEYAGSFDNPEFVVFSEADSQQGRDKALIYFNKIEELIEERIKERNRKTTLVCVINVAETFLSLLPNHYKFMFLSYLSFVQESPEFNVNFLFAMDAKALEEFNEDNVFLFKEIKEVAFNG